jgi:single-strand DNA-binding protein
MSRKRSRLARIAASPPLTKILKAIVNRAGGFATDAKIASFPSFNVDAKKARNNMYHTLIIAGNVGRDPEMKYAPSGQPYAKFSVATNRQYTKDGQTVKETVWFNVTVWAKQAEICNQYVKKGSKVLVEGRLEADPTTGSPRVWKSQDGSAKASFEVTASTVRFLSSRDEASGSQGNQGEYQPDPEIPF